MTSIFDSILKQFVLICWNFIQISVKKKEKEKFGLNFYFAHI